MYRDIYTVTAWLLSAVVISIVFYMVSIISFEKNISARIVRHLESSMDRNWFSDKETPFNKRKFIIYSGAETAKRVSEKVEPSWFSAFNPRSIKIVSIDGIGIKKMGVESFEINGFAVKFSDGLDYETELESNDSGKPSINRVMTIPISINEKPREVVVSYGGEVNPTIYVFIFAILAGVFALIRFGIPEPLSVSQRKWLFFLTQQDVSFGKADRLLRKMSNRNLSLSAQQKKVFDFIYSKEQDNFREAILLASEPNVKNLDCLGMLWFTWVVGKYKPSLIDFDELVAKAKELVLTEDKIVIDLKTREIQIRAIRVTLPVTPFLYYAWYARRRLTGDGWVVNPRSDKPDKIKGQELADFMWLYRGHAKAFKDLEEIGLRAKTLDQNRSRIKEEFENILGEELAQYYLFESEKDPILGRTRYRLKFDPSHMTIINGDFPQAAHSSKPISKSRSRRTIDLTLRSNRTAGS